MGLLDYILKPIVKITGYIRDWLLAETLEVTMEEVKRARNAGCETIEEIEDFFNNG